MQRFGLRHEAKCPNCPEQVESILHKVKDCPKAVRAWQELERVKRELNLNVLTDLSIENLIGAKDNVTKIELALQAELIHRLTSTNESFQATGIVRSVVKFVGYSERLTPELKTKFEEAIRNWPV